MEWIKQSLKLLSFGISSLENKLSPCHNPCCFKFHTNYHPPPRPARVTKNTQPINSAYIYSLWFEKMTPIQKKLFYYYMYSHSTFILTVHVFSQYMYVYMYIICIPEAHTMHNQIYKAFFTFQRKNLCELHWYTTSSYLDIMLLWEHNSIWYLCHHFLKEFSSLFDWPASQRLFSKKLQAADNGRINICILL